MTVAPPTAEDFQALLTRCNRLEAELQDLRNSLRRSARQTINVTNNAELEALTKELKESRFKKRRTS